MTDDVARAPAWFRGHAITFVTVNAALLVLWAATRDPGREDAFGAYWPAWVLAGWSLVLVTHALFVRREP